VTSVDSISIGRVRRIRGGEAPIPDAVPWRVSRRRAAPPPPRASAVAGAPTVRLGALTLDLDGVMAFALFLSMLFITELGTKGAAIFVALAPIYAFIRRKRLIHMLAARALLLIPPAVALVSILWSEAPSATLKYSIELAITVTAALLLCSARDQQAMFRGMMVAFLVYTMASVALGRSVGVGVGAGGEAFSGLTDSKNLIADIASTGILVSLFVGMLALRSRDILWMAIAALAILLEGHVLVAARSAGALLGLGVGLAAMAALMSLVIMPAALRALVTLVVAIGGLMVALSYRAISTGLMDLGTSLFDKDPTLTGRTYLWYRAYDLIHEKPMLGRGYSAFWLQGNIDAEGLWRYAGITGRSGFTFHNSAIQILVELGYLGLVLIAAAALIATVVLAVRMIRRPTPFVCFWMVLVIYELSRAPIEAVGMTPMFHSTVLLFAALGAGFGALREAAPHPSQAQTLRFVPVSYVSGSGWGAPAIRVDRRALRVLAVKPSLDQ
jgi:exopolysaccharide production protein ExoQ